MSDYNTYLRINADSISPYMNLSNECFGIKAGILSIFGIHTDAAEKTLNRSDSDAFVSDWATVGSDWWNVLSARTNG